MALGHHRSMEQAGLALPSGHAKGPAGIRPRRLPRELTTVRMQSRLRHGLPDLPSSCCCRLPSRGP
eukprot:8037356-Alexandrium_andersonii.AAC.1